MISKSKAPQVALRVPNAYGVHTSPNESDISYLRKITSDISSPADDLACHVVDGELRKMKIKPIANVAAAKEARDGETGLR